MADEFCPSCHSKISENPLEERVQGEVEEQEEDSDIGTGNRPIPRWSEDPVLTRRGFNGDEFVGVTRLTKRIIKEIQELRTNQEEELGFTEAQKTNFSPLEEGSTEVASRRHITELRESTEKILNLLGLSLSEYFQLDDNGEINTSFLEKDDWTDVERGEPYLDKDGESKSSFTLPDNTTEASPTFPRHTPIGATHFEDLRRQIALLLFRETWTPHEETTLVGTPGGTAPSQIGDMTEKGPGLWTVPFIGISQPLTSQPSGNCGQLEGNPPVRFNTDNESKEIEWENFQEPEDDEEVPKKVHFRYSYFHHEENNYCPILNDPNNNLSWAGSLDKTSTLNLFYTFSNTNLASRRQKLKLSLNSKFKGKVNISFLSSTINLPSSPPTIVTTPSFEIGTQNDAADNEIKWAFFYQIGILPVDPSLTITVPASPNAVTFMRYLFRGDGEFILNRNVLEDFQTLLTSLGALQSVSDFYDGTLSEDGLFLSSVAMGILAATDVDQPHNLDNVPSWEIERSVEGIFDPPTVITK